MSNENGFLQSLISMFDDKLIVFDKENEVLYKKGLSVDEELVFVGVACDKSIRDHSLIKDKLKYKLNTFVVDDVVYKVGTISEIEQQSVINETGLLSRMIDSIFEGIVLLDPLNNIVMCNDKAAELVSISKMSLMQKNICNEVMFLGLDYKNIDYSDCEIQSEEVVLMTDDGLFRNLKLSLSNILSDSKEIIGKVLVFYDISNVKKREEEILYLSYHDVLTGLYNRTFFEEEVKRLDIERQLPLSVIMGDLNGLKLSNDIFGHHVGDALLRKAAEVMKSCTRGDDIVARWGGDEFIILLPKTKEEAAHMVLDRINREFDLMAKKGLVKGLNPSISLGYGTKHLVDEDFTEVIKVAESNMYKRKMLSKESIHSGAITSMKTALFEKSNETEEHTNRLYSLSQLVAKNYQFSKEEHDDLELLCMLHDIGKIGIDDGILNKPGKLDDVEWAEMKKHSEVGFRIAQATPELKNVSLFILYHHERYDGTGYPKGLKKHEIPLINRVLSVADAYDAMTHDRIYRKAMSKNAALREITRNSGTQFDPEVVDIFIDEINKIDVL